MQEGMSSNASADSVTVKSSILLTELDPQTWSNVDLMEKDHPEISNINQNVSQIYKETFWFYIRKPL